MNIRMTAFLTAALALGTTATACIEVAEPTTSPAALGDTLFVVYARSELATYEALAGCPNPGKSECAPFVAADIAFEEMSEICDTYQEGRCIESEVYPETCEEYPLLIECHEAVSPNWDACCTLQGHSSIAPSGYAVDTIVCCRMESTGPVCAVAGDRLQ